MHWDDEAYLISKNRYNENSVIAEFYTKKHGKRTGIIFGATSKKIKNYLLIGNKLHISYNSKNEDKIGSIKIEIIKANTPFFFENKKKLLCISTAMHLIKLLTVENQKNIKIFDLIDNYFEILKDEYWVEKYVFWELNLLKLIGFDLDLKKIIKSENINNEIKYFIESTKEKKYVPNFLVEFKTEKIEKNNLFKGLKLVGDYLEKNILKPNNLNYPVTRLDFLNQFKP
tara:strand:+ start:1574 stop:2257 length:684 start_codon:yes stop_codon:yes gene_type:complete